MTSVLNRGAALFDERDYNHATDNTYKNYREQASRLYDKRNECSQQSQKAYKNGDKQRAHELSVQLQQYLEQAEDYNKRAAEYVFVQNNADSEADEIDLHGLYVKEAKWILQKRISEAMRQNQRQLKVIVGKGKHSQNGVAKLKPAIDEMCSESGLRHHIDQHNTGVMVIDLSTASTVPSHWDTSPVNGHQNSGYSQQQQPQYSQQPQYYQQNQQNQQNQQSSNALVGFLVKLVCQCLK